MLMNSGGPPDWRAEVEAAEKILDAANVPTTPTECEADERPLSLTERIQMLVTARDNHASASRFNASQLSKLQAAFRAASPLKGIVVCAESLEEAAAIIVAMQAAESQK